MIRAAAGSLDSDSVLSEEDRRANLVAIEREVEYLDRLVANLLDLSRIEAGALRADRDVYDIDDLVTRALDRVRPRLGGRALELSIEPVAVRVDAVFLDAALANVLDNAMKYTPTDARLRIAARGSRPGRAPDRRGRRRRRPDEALPRLFEKFYRVPGTGRVRSGLGHRARRRARARRGDGRHGDRRPSPSWAGWRSDFELPLATRPGDVDGTRRHETPAATAPTVLVVEDDAATRVVLARELAAAGYRVIEAEDARTALERFAARRPDLVLLDLGLPDLDGLAGDRGDPPRGRDADPDPVRPVRGAREGRGARARSRRLRDQAVRDRRAAGAHRRRPAPCGGSGRRPAGALAVGPIRAGRRAPRGPRGRPARRPLARASSRCCRCSSPSRDGS